MTEHLHTAALGPLCLCVPDWLHCMIFSITLWTKPLLTSLQPWSLYRWYEAEIEEIDEENGTAAITFLGYGNAEVTSLLNLKPLEEGRKAKEDSGSLPMSKWVPLHIFLWHFPCCLVGPYMRVHGCPVSSNFMIFFLSLSFSHSRKEMIAQQREYKKKKALKKAQRIKELEQEREDQKVKWQQFNNKAYSKNKKGQVNIRVSLQLLFKYLYSSINCKNEKFDDNF